MSIALASPPRSSSSSTVIHTGLGGYASSTLPHCLAAGRSYHRRRRNLARGRTSSQDSIEGDDEVLAREARDAEARALDAYRQSIAGRTFVDLTYYEQLGLTPFDVSPEDVRKAYRRVLILHHPDKTGKTENDPNYLSIQKAFQTLLDVKLKRAYDSQCDFDEAIPSGKEVIRQNLDDDVEDDHKAVCFYALYGPVFERNARFSEKQPVPVLGDDDLDIHSVHAFYEFWNTFDSWRDFTHNAEHDIDTAGGRYQKRDMMKKNEAAAKKQKRREYQRLSSLIDRALANDPRLIRVKRAEKAAKAKIAQDKEDARLAAEKAVADAAAAQAQAEAEAEAQVKADAKAAKFAREKQKKIVRKAKKAFREAVNAAPDMPAFLDVEEVEFLCDAMDLVQIQSLTNDMAPLVTVWTTLRGDAYAEKKKSKYV